MFPETEGRTNEVIQKIELKQLFSMFLCGSFCYFRFKVIAANGFTYGFCNYCMMSPSVTKIPIYIVFLLG